MKSPEETYRRFVEFEERAAGIYLQLASRYSQDRELGPLWLEMAMQEKQHAGLLQFCLAERLFASDLPSSAEIEEVDALFKHVEERAADPMLTPPQAFMLAIELETSEVNAIYGRLTSTLHRSMYLLKRKISTSLQDHVVDLLRSARKFGAAREAAEELDRLIESSHAINRQD